MALHIDVSEEGELADAIGSAFPTLARLGVVLNDRLDDSIVNYQWDYPVLRSELIVQKNAKYEIEKLLQALLAGNPGHPELSAFAAQHRKHIKDGATRGELSKIIESAYPTPQLLNDQLARGLGDSIDNYGTPENLAPIVRGYLVREYNARYGIDKLIAACLESSPGNGRLLEIAWRYRLIKRPSGPGGDLGPKDGSLERMLDPQRGFTDVGKFMGRLAQIINCTCQIAIPVDGGTGYGTGFLIGNQTLLTNWHVAEMINGNNRRSVRFVFDYRTDPDGMTIAKPVTHVLFDHDSNWLIHRSLYHKDDGVSVPKEQILAGTRPEDCLDYAVIRLGGAPGSLPVGANPSAGDPPRGFIPLRANADSDFDADAAVFIFQHPYEGGMSLPLQLDWQKPGIIGQNQNKTRILYDVNTRKGSSGSPCFNAKLELIALHHAGGNDWPAPTPYLYNQGIPIGKILGNVQLAGVINAIN